MIADVSSATSAIGICMPLGGQGCVGRPTLSTGTGLHRPTPGSYKSRLVSLMSADLWVAQGGCGVSDVPCCILVETCGHAAIGAGSRRVGLRG